MALHCVLMEYELGRFKRAFETHKIMPVLYLHLYCTNELEMLNNFIKSVLVPGCQTWSHKTASFPCYWGNNPGRNVWMRGKIHAATSLLPITSTHCPTPLTTQQSHSRHQTRTYYRWNTPSKPRSAHTSHPTHKRLAWAWACSRAAPGLGVVGGVGDP